MLTNILEYLENSAKIYPQKIALADENNNITYDDYLTSAKIIGSYLIRYHKENNPVAVLIDRNLESIVSFMGIVYSGNFYVPIDIGLPPARIKLMLETLNPFCIVNTCRDKALPGEVCFDEWDVLDYASLLNTKINDCYLAKIRKRHIDMNPLYAIFTSGSTGIPKSVLISHRSVIDLSEQFTKTFGFISDDCFGNQAPFDFDVSVKDIYFALKNSSSLQIIPKRLFSIPLKLVEYLNERKINIAIWATSAICIIANFKTFSRVLPNTLRIVMFSGEVMPNKALNYWRKNCPEIQYVNLYGPTEITCNCTYYKVKRSFQDIDVLPIGSTFYNSKVFLLDEQDNQVTIPGLVGEICVAGTCLALGYYNNPEKTAEVFCQNPLNPYYYERIYRTGDLGKYNAYGELIFVSRKDFQIKHMGHRIELGELEVHINSFSFIDNACCLYDSKNNKIICFYQSAVECDKDIILALSKYLPKYMWPNRCIHMHELPMNKNGKINRTYLRENHL